MNETKRRKAIRLLDALDAELQTAQPANAVADARKALQDAIGVLSDDSASYKASDYAVARVHAMMMRLIGYRTLALSEPTRTAWKNFEDFVYSDARDDLRGVGGPNPG